MSADSKDIAIVGIGCRLPSANNIKEFWDLLLNGKNAVVEVPSHRWRKEQYSNLPSNLDKTKAGFLKVAIDEFDEKFFEMSSKDALATDPQQRLLLEVVWEALEDAGITSEETRGARGAVFVGSWHNDYKQILLESLSAPAPFQVYRGNSIGAGAARISHFLGWTGPCIGSESDCAASLTSVHMACKALQNNECSIALACGVNLLVKPFTLEVAPALLSPNYACKAFDKSADGFARAEGVAALLFKRYSDAVKDKNRIWGIVRGSAVNQEGLSRSMGTPTVTSQVEVMQRAMKDGGVHPYQIDYLEAHGTGTVVGDAVEIQAINKAYCQGVERDEKLVISSVKTNIGHTESCSGIAGVIKVILSIHNNLIPKHINLTSLHHKINLEKMNATIPLEALSCPRSSKPRLAAVSSFGVVGQNCHLIIQEPPSFQDNNPLPDKLLNPERPLHMLKITAKSKPALDALLSKYQNLLETSLESFQDISYTANTTRDDFPWRAVILAEDNKSACDQIKSLEKRESSQANSICFLFTGQGSQYLGMAKELYETSFNFKFHFDYCNAFLKSRYNICLKSIFDGEPQGSFINQTGIFVVEYSLLKLWQSWGVTPAYALGHSLGEFCAAVAAQIISVEDVLFLIAERSLLFDQLPPGKMLAVEGDKVTVEKLQGKAEIKLDYAAFNSSSQTVVSGCPATILKFQRFLNEENVNAIVLQSPYAFHSKEVEPILQEFKKSAGKIEFKPSTGIKFISGMYGKEIESIEAGYWVQHLRHPVNFLGACHTLIKDLSCSTFLEIGPHPVLTSFVKQYDKGNLLCLPSIRRNTSDWKIILTSASKLFLNGVKINWEGFDQNYKRKLLHNVLPSYPFQRTRFWPKFVEMKPLVQKPELFGSKEKPVNVEEMLRKVLNLDAAEEINQDMDLSIMGMDSLMTLELLSLMQDAVGKEKVIPPGIKTCRTLRALSEAYEKVIEDKWIELPPPTLDETRAQSIIDAILPEYILPERPDSHVAPSQIKSLLLSGATGFVGSHMLKELLEGCPQLEKIYCLVRGNNPLKRLLFVLKENNISIPEATFEEKIQVIQGDLTQTQLGLESKDYSKLSEEIEGIFHAGAFVHHYEYYRETENNSEGIRNINVGGLQNILRFACKGKTKHIFHVSSLAIADGKDKDGRLLENWPSTQRLSSLDTNMGYAISKIVNELHLKEAEKRGIPCKSLRYCQLRAGTTSGKSFSKDSHLMKISIFILSEGIVPQEPFPINVLPVDKAMQTTIKLIFNDKAPFGVYNVSHPRPVPMPEAFSKLANDFNMKIVDFEQFSKRVVERCAEAKIKFEQDRDLHTLKKVFLYELQLVYKDQNLTRFFVNFARTTDKGQQECKEFWKSKKLEEFIPQVYSQVESPIETLRRDLKTAANEGLFNIF